MTVKYNRQVWKILLKMTHWDIWQNWHINYKSYFVHVKFYKYYEYIGIM